MNVAPPSPTIALTALQLEMLVEAAAERGAMKALQSIGLHDDNARRDIDDLRELLGGWRLTRRSAWKTTVTVLTGGVLTAMGAAVWVYIKTNLKGG
jgi:uncharacterized protein DUF6127